LTLTDRRWLLVADDDGVLDLEMHASHGGETLHIIFAPGREHDVAKVVECALRRSAEPLPNWRES
jgi:hypothetical protein